MNWVDERFAEQQAYIDNIAGFWNEMRDSAGDAVNRFNNWLAGTTHGAPIRRKDCASLGSYCMRVEKASDNSWIEIFLDEANRKLKVSAVSNSRETTTICGYRLNEDRDGLEFFTDRDGGIAIETACERVLGDFLFRPFPAAFKRPA